MSFNILTVLIDNQEKQQRQTSLFNNSLYQKAEYLKNEYTGRLGVDLVESAIPSSKRPVENKLAPDVFKLWINDQRVNIRFATVTSKLNKKTGVRTGNCFQYDGNLFGKKYTDFTILFGLDPDYLYVTILGDIDPRTPHPILGKVGHFRKNETNKCKYDLNFKHLYAGIEGGITIKLGLNELNNYDKLRDFINRHIKSV